MLTSRRLRAILLPVGVSVLLLQGHAHAVPAVEILSASRSGDVLSVSGTATFSDEPWSELGTDAPHDALPPGPAGLDLTGAAIRTRAGGDIEFRWTLSALPPVTDGLDMTFLGWTFCARGPQVSCFELDAGRYYFSSDQPVWAGQLWRCADEMCEWAEQTPTNAPVTVTLNNPAGGPATVSAAVPAWDLGLGAGGVVTPVAFPGGAVFARIWQWYDELPASGVYTDTGDGLQVSSTYTAPGRSVELAVEALGLDPASVTYGKPTAVHGDGSFTAELGVAGLWGEKAVYSRACFGTDGCAYGTQVVTL